MTLSPTLIERAARVMFEREYRDSVLELPHAWKAEAQYWRDHATAALTAAGFDKMEEALRQIDGGTDNATEFFKVRMGNRKSPTWYAVNVLQDYLAAAQGAARQALAALKDI